MEEDGAQEESPLTVDGSVGKVNASKAARRIHWLAPTLMSVSLALAIVVVLVHHFFYRSRNGMIVQSSSEQEWYTRIGTGLAFLVKSLLEAAVAAAYAQQLWLSLRSKPIAIERLDSLFAGLVNVWSFSDVRLWISYWMLGLLALTHWLVPLAAVVTPGTLTVGVSVRNTTLIDQVPQLDFIRSSANYAVFLSNYEESYEEYTYMGPQQIVSRVGLGSALLGEILAIPSIHPNATYNIQFSGPAVKCSSLTGTNLTIFQNSIVNLTTENNKAVYYAWTGPFDEFNMTGAGLYPLDTGMDDTGGAKLFIGSGEMFVGKSWHVLECVLFNVTYGVGFTFLNGIGTISTEVLEWLNPVNGYSVFNGSLGSQTSLMNQTLSYQSIMDVYGRLLIGTLAGEGRTITDASGDEALPTNKIVELASLGNYTDIGAFEELFQNMTLSLLSVPSLLQDPAVASLTNITLQNTYEVYVYRPQNLYLAYSIALFCALFCVIIGFISIRGNSASFSNSFSTIVRTTRAEEFDRLVSADEMDGADPLPKHIASAMVLFDSRGIRSRKPEVTRSR